MKRFLLAILLVLCVSQASAIELASKDIVKNRPPGYCTWACIETLDKYLGLDKLQGLVDQRERQKTVKIGNHVYPSHPGIFQAVNMVLDAAKIRYEHQKYGNFDRTLLRKYAKSNGCIVTVEFDIGYHSVIIPDYDDDSKEIAYYDPNSQRRGTMTRKQFDIYWTGETLVMFPEKK